MPGNAIHECPAWAVHQLSRSVWFWAAWQSGANAATPHAPRRFGTCLSRANARVAAQQAAGPEAREVAEAAAAQAYAALKATGKM